MAATSCAREGVYLYVWVFVHVCMRARVGVNAYMYACICMRVCWCMHVCVWCMLYAEKIYHTTNILMWQILTNARAIHANIAGHVLMH